MATKVDYNRIKELAKPKPFHPAFIEDRRSVYWVDHSPYTPGQDGTTVVVLTPRQAELVYNKRLHPEYLGHRPSPIWPVTPGAKSAESTPRVQTLATPKSYHPEYKRERTVYTIIPENALSAEPTERIQSLATAKKYRELPIVEPKQWDWGDWPNRVSESAKQARASMRVEDLANPKNYHPRFQPERPIRWVVSAEAKKAEATTRITQLSRAKSRGQPNDDYDPYHVSLAARQAIATPRMNELCAPIPRKVRAKKIV